LTENHIEEKRKELVGYWFYNLKNNIENEEVLILIYRFSTNHLNELLNNIHSKLEYNILNVKELAKDKSLLKVNTILIGTINSIDKFQLSDLKNLRKKILIYNMHNSSDIHFFWEYSNATKPIINENEEYLFYLKWINPSELIYKPSYIVKEFILNIYGNFSSLRETDLKYLIKETNLNQENQYLLEKLESISLLNNKKENVYQTAFGEIITNSLQKEYLLRDIIILEEKGLLTSRLSIVLYRKAFLDIDANITEIGRYFNKLIGNKSKAIDLKKICKDSSVNYDCLSKTKVKAYDLNVKTKSEKDIRIEIELEIKEHIAKKLIYFTAPADSFGHPARSIRTV
jgi:hypothetical protein